MEVGLCHTWMEITKTRFFYDKAKTVIYKETIVPPIITLPNHEASDTVKTLIKHGGGGGWGRSGLVVRPSYSRTRGRGFDPHLGRCVVSFSKTHLVQ